MAGYCPACGGASLFLGSGGYVTCSRVDCRRPDAAADILGDPETQHIATFTADGFTIRHPLRERLDGALENCDLHVVLANRVGPPVQPGTYRAYGDSDSGYVFEVVK